MPTDSTSKGSFRSRKKIVKVSFPCVAVWGSCGVREFRCGEVALWGSRGVGESHCGKVALWESCVVGGRSVGELRYRGVAV